VPLPPETVPDPDPSPEEEIHWTLEEVNEFDVPEKYSGLGGQGGVGLAMASTWIAVGEAVVDIAMEANEAMASVVDTIVNWWTELWGSEPEPETVVGLDEL
jgi:hypothetical protein